MVVTMVNDPDFHRLPRIGERKTCDVRPVSVAAGSGSWMLERVEVVSLFRNNAPTRAD